MKIVVAGGSGLIGRALCPALLAEGHEVVVLSRRPQRVRLVGVRVVGWQPPVVGPWADALAGAGAVINLAGESVGTRPWTAGRKRVLRDSRLLSTSGLVNAIAGLPHDRRPSVLVNASGTDVYEGEDARAADERTPPADTFLARLCRDWELEAQRAEALRLRVVLARTSLVIAPGAPSLRLIALPFRVFLGGPVGSGQQWVSWIDIADTVSLYMRAIADEDLGGPLNLSAPDPRRQADFARALGAALRRPSSFRTPAWLIRLALREQATLVLGSRRVWPARALEAGYTFTRPRLEASLAERL